MFTILLRGLRVNIVIIICTIIIVVYLIIIIVVVKNIILLIGWVILIVLWVVRREVTRLSMSSYRLVAKIIAVWIINRLILCLLRWVVSRVVILWVSLQ